MFALQQFFVGMLLTIGGPMLFLIFGVLLLVKKPMSAAMPSADVTVKIASLQAEMRMLEEKIRIFTVPYGYYSPAGVLYDFTTLEEDVRTYQAQVSAKEACGLQVKALSADAVYGAFRGEQSG